MSASVNSTPEEGWQPSRDLLVFIGAADHVELQRQRDAGQVRCLVLDPGWPQRKLPPESERELLLCTDLPSLNLALNRLSSPYPHNIHCIDRTEGAVNRDFILGLGTLVERRLGEITSAYWTRQRFSERWAKNLEANRDLLQTIPHIGCLEGVARAQLALVVSGGPSLTSALPALAAASGRALIIAELRSARAMINQGIAADVVVLSDADIELDDLRALDACPETLFVIEAAVDRRLLSFRPGRTALFTGNQVNAERLKSRFGPAICLENGGSVSNCAFSLARRLGCDPIALVGQDLALCAGERYASGAGGRENPHPRTRVQVTTVDGKQAWTHSDLQGFRRWFEAQARAQQDGRQLFNTSPTGANIAGFAATPLSELCERFALSKPMDLRERLRAQLASGRSGA